MFNLVYVIRLCEITQLIEGIQRTKWYVFVGFISVTYLLSSLISSMELYLLLRASNTSPA